MNTNFHTESRMRENCTYGSMRGRAFPTGRPALLYPLLGPKIASSAHDRLVGCSVDRMAAHTKAAPDDSVLRLIDRALGKQTVDELLDE